MSSDKSATPGSLLAGRFEIQSLLGQGGMGNVYKAFDTFLKVQVAVKIINPAISRDEEAIRRLKNEVVLARKFTHPNACRIYDIGEAEGALYISMEYIEGETLANVLQKQGRLPLQQIIRIMQDVLRALVEAHRAGVIHRDLKPQNIMISEEKAYLMDFGISFSEDLDRLTKTGMLIGTPYYMSPEQFLDGKADERSDIYSLGIILFEMATGKLPFKANTPAVVMYCHVNTPAQPPSACFQDLPSDFDAIVLKALEKDPKARFASANELLARLVRLYAADVHSELNQTIRQDAPLKTVQETAPLSASKTAPLPHASRESKPAHHSDRAGAQAQYDVTHKNNGKRNVIAFALLATIFLFGAVDLIWISPMSAKLKLETYPSGATIKIDDMEDAHRTPAEIRFPRSGPHTLELSLDGYQDYVETIDASPAGDLFSGLERRVSFTPAQQSPRVPTDSKDRAEEPPRFVEPEKSAVDAKTQAITPIPLPPVPVLFSPENGKEIQFVNEKPLIIQLNWNSVLEAEHYDVQVSEDSSFTRLIEQNANVQGKNSLQIAIPKTHKKRYLWRVRSVDRSGNKSPWSEPYSFIVQEPATEVALPAVAPWDVKMLTDANAYFSYKEFAGAVNLYEKYLDKHPDAKNELLPQIIKCYYNLGVIAIRESNCNRASDYFRQVLFIDLEDQQARDAISIARNCQKTGPENPEVKTAIMQLAFRN